jgi:outer membrane protein TolC
MPGPFPLEIAMKPSIFLSLTCLVGAALLAAATWAAESAKPSRDEAAKQVKALLKDRRDTLEKMVDILTQQFQQGTVDFHRVAIATDRLCDAEFDLAANRAERIAALERKLKNLADAEKLTQSRFEMGLHATQLDVLEAKAARLKAEVQLLREKAEGGAK